MDWFLYDSSLLQERVKGKCLIYDGFSNAHKSTFTSINPFVPNAPLLNPPETSENFPTL